MNVAPFFKCWEEITQPHSIKTQKTWFLNNHLMETSTHSLCIANNIFISDFVSPSFTVSYLFYSLTTLPLKNGHVQV